MSDVPSNDSENTKTATSRGGRARGALEGGRGGRGRGGERGRGGVRGGRGSAGAATNGGRSVDVASSTTDAGGWATTTSDTAAGSSWDQPNTGGSVGEAAVNAGGWDDAAAPTESKPTPAADAQKSSLIPEGTKKSWASMLAVPKPVATISKQTSPIPAAAESLSESQSDQLVAPGIAPVHPVATDWGASQVTTDAASTGNEAPTPAAASTTAESQRISSATLSPPKDPLTEDNLEHLPDQSGPRPTDTVASTRDAHSTLGNAQPSLQSVHQAPIARPGLGGGYAASAQKAAGQGGRSLSFQRLKEQQDAVVMPSNHAIDRSTVQFGSMNLDGQPKPLDVDEEREDAETRAQPPQQSPSQPRASLPPVPRAPATASEHTAIESLPPAAKHAPGLPTPSQQHVTPISQSPQTSGVQGLVQPTSDNQNYSQLGGRYGGAFSQEPNAPPQKAYDPFSSQLYPQSQNEPQSVDPSLSQGPSQMSQPTTSQPGSYPGHGDYGSQYPSETSRGAYSTYYGTYSQPSSSLQENAPPQRSTSGFGAGDGGYGGSHPAQSQSRFSEGQTSSHTASNPPMAVQHHSGSHSHQNQHLQQQGQGHGGYGGHPYGSPYNHSSFYQQYNNQGYPNYYSYGQQSYGAQYGGKSGMYGGPGHHGYGMSSHASYDNTNSPANTGAFGGSSIQGRESSMSSGLNDYPRSGSTQPPSQPQHANASSGFGNSINDAYGRSSSGFGGHNQGFGGAPSTSANEDSIKSLHDPKTGPSPLGQGGRPGSAFNNNNPSGPNYGPPGNQQGAFGGSGYPSHLGALHGQYGGSGYGGIGGLGGQGGSHAGQTGYGYGSGFGNNTYGGRGGGWGNHYNSQYGQH